jgi:hypothetical protein
MTETDDQKTTPRSRPSKKTEMVEVRVSPEEKSAFLDKCQAVGRSASDVIRDAMRAYSDFGPRARLPGSPFMIVASFVGAAAGVLSLSLFQPAAEAEGAVEAAAYSEFRLYDPNGDRMVTMDEFGAYFGHYYDAVMGVEHASGHTATRDQTVLYGLAVRMTLADWNVDERVFRQAPDQIGAVCWAAADNAYQIAIGARFIEWDTNSDGLITLEEYGAYRAREHQLHFDSSDTNNDGVLTVTDFMGGEVNVNGAGTVIQLENEPHHITVCREDAGPHRFVENPPAPNRPLTQEEAAFFLTIFDLNADGEVTPAEMVAASTR